MSGAPYRTRGKRTWGKVINGVNPTTRAARRDTSALETANNLAIVMSGFAEIRALPVPRSALKAWNRCGACKLWWLQNLERVVSSSSGNHRCRALNFNAQQALVAETAEAVEAWAWAARAPATTAVVRAVRRIVFKVVIGALQGVFVVRR